MATGRKKNRRHHSAKHGRLQAVRSLHLVAGLTVALLALGACTKQSGDTGASNKTTGVPNNKSVSSVSTTPAVDRGPNFPGKQPEDLAAFASETVTYAEGIEVTTDLLDTLSSADNGLCSWVQVTNNSPNTIRFSYTDWKLQDPAGVIYDSRPYDSEDSNLTFLSGQLAAHGGKKGGWLCYEVSGPEEIETGIWPPREPGKPVIVGPDAYVALFQPDPLSNARIGFIYENGIGIYKTE